MSQQLLSAVLEMLDLVAQKAPAAEVDAALGRIAGLSRSPEEMHFAEALRPHVARISEAASAEGLSERGLSLLIETTRDLSGTLAVHDLLRLVVRRARNLVAADIAWVTILDEDSGLFRTICAEGNLTPSTAEMTSHVDMGAVSVIMKSKSFFDTLDYLGDTRFSHSVELDRIFRLENIVSLAGFPIMCEGKVQGLLFVADRYSRRLSGRELSVLGSFALHAGVAMRNADAFRLLSEALGEAQRNRNALIEHIQRVEASAEAHDEMTSLLASGADISLFLRRMANRIDGVVFLINDQLVIRDEFASPSGVSLLAADIRQGRLDRAALIAAITRSRDTGRSIAVFDRGDEQCRVIALHGDTGRGDSLVIGHRQNLDAIEIRNLERSAVALAIARLWNEKRETDKVIASSTLLRHLVLVTPPDPSTISAIRARLDLPADMPVMLALAVVTGADRPTQTAVMRECAERTNILVDLFEDYYLAIGAEPEVREFLGKLGKARSDWKVGGILSDPFVDLSESPVRLERVSRALQILRNMKQLDRFILQSEVNIFAKLFEAGDVNRIARYLRDHLGPLDSVPARQRAAMKETLLCYFDSQYNVSRTAKTLKLHVNTVRQRLDYLRETLKDWDHDPVAALELHLALRLAAVTEDLE